MHVPKTKTGTSEVDSAAAAASASWSCVRRSARNHTSDTPRPPAAALLPGAPVVLAGCHAVPSRGNAAARADAAATLMTFPRSPSVRSTW